MESRDSRRQILPSAFRSIRVSRRNVLFDHVRSIAARTISEAHLCETQAMRPRRRRAVSAQGDSAGRYGDGFALCDCVLCFLLLTRSTLFHSFRFSSCSFCCEPPVPSTMQLPLQASPVFQRDCLRQPLPPAFPSYCTPRSFRSSSSRNVSPCGRHRCETRSDPRAVSPAKREGGLPPVSLCEELLVAVFFFGNQSGLSSRMPSEAGDERFTDL